MDDRRADSRRIDIRCCVVGAGPAGLMVGYLLARAGVPVLVLEKQAEFRRDVRGDTIHPATLDILHELGLLSRFLARPHQEVRELHARVGDRDLRMADFGSTPTYCRFLVLMPDFEFLAFLAEEARVYSAFDLRMATEVTELIEREGRVVGVLAQPPAGRLEVRADLVIGADGRESTVRRQAGLLVDELGVPSEAAWVRFTKRPGDPAPSLGYVNFGRVLLVRDRGDHWQCELVMRKGELDRLRTRGLSTFRETIVRLAPFLSDRIGELDDWNGVKVVTLRIDRLRRWWQPGLLCIGDCAHAMSPLGGVGINLAIQDAVASANLLASSLREGPPSDDLLDVVQQRRILATKLTQRFQVLLQDHIWPLTGEAGPTDVPTPLLLLDRLQWLRRIPARLIGVGIRPEHVARVTSMPS
jgi:2-polyprenyl-6-methoxyphenol hydroxylase-like FAD-dependent oxidoreductase